MNKVLEFKADGHWYNAVVWVWEPGGVIEGTVSILITQSEFKLSGHGVAICAREDEFDIRIGVPLALKRALSQIKKVNRKAVTRAFFQQWREAHPNYHDTNQLLVGLLLLTSRAEAVPSAVEESTPEKKGRFIVGGLGSVPTFAAKRKCVICDSAIPDDAPCCPTCDRRGD